MIHPLCAFDDRNSQALRFRWLTQAAAVAALALGSVPAMADTGYNETSSGDLSNVGTSPTAVTLGIGSNFISGTTGSTAGVIDRDYFTFTLAPGQALTAIQVLQGTTNIPNATPGDVARSFIGLEAGATFDTLPTTTTASGLLGYTHYSQSMVGTDILDDIALGAGAQGFTRPLGAGSYSVWIQEANAGTASYFFNFLVASVPEPSSWAMMLTGFGVIGWSMRHGQKGKRPSSARSLAI